MAFKFRKGMQAGTREIPAASLRTGSRVDRSPRVGPTPETLDKLQPDGLLELLVRGPDDGGIDPAAHEALLEIEATFRIIERIVGASGPTWIGDRTGVGDAPISDGAARWWAIWNLWATELFRVTAISRGRGRGVLGLQVAVIVESRKRVDGDAVAILRQAADLWQDTRRAYDDAIRAGKNPIDIWVRACQPSER
ncbi:MAG: hypothetical protein U1E23_09490 [Reyranellaceae bacterium]